MGYRYPKLGAVGGQIATAPIEMFYEQRMNGFLEYLERKRNSGILSLREILNQIFAKQEELATLKKKGHTQNTEQYKRVKTEILAIINYAKINYVHANKWSPFAINCFRDLEVLLVNWKSIFISYNLECGFGKDIPDYILGHYEATTKRNRKELLEISQIGRIIKKFLKDQFEVSCSESWKDNGPENTIIENPWLFLQLVDLVSFSKEKDNLQHREFLLFNGARIIKVKPSILETKCISWYLQKVEKRFVSKKLWVWHDYLEKYKHHPSHVDLWNNFLAFYFKIVEAISEFEKALNDLRPKIGICLAEISSENSLDPSVTIDIEWIKSRIKTIGRIDQQNTFVEIKEFSLPGDDLSKSLGRLVNYEICFLIIPVTNDILASEKLSEILGFKESYNGLGAFEILPIKIRQTRTKGHAFLDEEKIEYFLGGKPFNQYKDDKHEAMTKIIEQMNEILCQHL